MVMIGKIVGILSDISINGGFHSHRGTPIAGGLIVDNPNLDESPSVSEMAWRWWDEIRLIKIMDRT